MMMRQRGPQKLPRAQCWQFKHGQALECIQRDYLGPDPLFGNEFDMMFRLSRRRFQKLLEDVGNLGTKFYLEKRDAMNRKVASIEARLLLPLKTLTYGVMHHCFCDYFQMSRNFARKCCFELDKILKSLYTEEHLRLKTKEDLKNISIYIRQFMVLMVCLVLWIACILTGRIVPRLGRAASQEKKSNQQLYWRQSQIIILGSGMHPMDMQEH
jgi:hypothetical protein